MAGDGYTVRFPRWLVFAVAALVLIGGGLGAGLALGGGDDNKVKVAKGTATTSTSTTTVPFAGVAPAGGNDDDGGGGGNNDDGGGAPAEPAEPAVPAATAEVSKSAGCPTIVTWEGHGGTRGYTLQVYNFAGNQLKYNGPVAGAGSHSYDCVPDNGADGIPVIGLVRLNTNTDTGTVSDTG